MSIDNIKIAYIGGGSRSWAHILMNDLAKEADLSGEVRLYDIDHAAAKVNEKIGNDLSARKEAVGKWQYKYVKTLDNALIGADFVIISILPATFDEMESDVHTPEKFGIFQSVGDTTGPGGIVRALRTIPMIKVIAEAVRKNCPEAWVINYTNPMSMTVKTLYKVFPDIKAFGCCHEVFSVQKLLGQMLGGVARNKIFTNVLGINHFTFFTAASYNGEDLFPKYRRFVEDNYEKGYPDKEHDLKTDFLGSCHRVKFDLFLRYGAIAAAGDRHLAEFCPKNWYLQSPEQVAQWKFRLTPVSLRREQLKERLLETKLVYEGKKELELKISGEEGVMQIKALLGGGDMVTNVNYPNNGQMEGIFQGGIVETNVKLSKNDIQPIYAGSLPQSLLGLVYKVATEQAVVVDAAFKGDYEAVFEAFCFNQLVNLSHKDARALFNEMLFNTSAYLPYYKDYIAKKHI